MRNTRVLILTGLVLLLASCGAGKTTPDPINGFWNGQLLNAGGTPAFDFTATLSQNGGTSVTVSNFTFSTSAACFSGQTNETATFSSTGTSTGLQTGQFGMTITSAPQNGQSNVLTQQGTLQNSSTNESVSGTWTLNGAGGCSGSGTFIMNPLPPA